MTGIFLLTLRRVIPLFVIMIISHHRSRTLGYKVSRAIWHLSKIYKILCVVLLNHKPDTYSDRFSLAVILFLLFFRNHPLVGNRDDGDTDPTENELNLYCKQSVFIYDKDDKSNRPRDGIDINVIRL